MKFEMQIGFFLFSRATLPSPKPEVKLQLYYIEVHGYNKNCVLYLQHMMWLKKF